MGYLLYYLNKNMGSVTSFAKSYIVGDEMMVSSCHLSVEVRIIDSLNSLSATFKNPSIESELNSCSVNPQLSKVHIELFLY